MAYTIHTYLLTKKNMDDFDKVIEAPDEINIIMNGPSIRNDFNNREYILKERAVLCVNLIAYYDFFDILRPCYYVIADPKFWSTVKNNLSNPQIKEEKEKWDGLADILMNKVKWKMTLFLPFVAEENTDLIKYLEQNKNINIHYFNTTAYRGLAKYKHYFYKKKLSMPAVNNVLIPSIQICILLGIKNIFLFGVDHDFFKSVEVDENNRLIVRRKHGYELQNQKMAVYAPNGDYITMGDYLTDLGKMWTSYYEIEQFAKEVGCHIYNMTPNSYIDAFERR